MTPPPAPPPARMRRAACAAALWGVLQAAFALHALLCGPAGNAVPDPVSALVAGAVPILVGLAIASWIALPHLRTSLRSVLGLRGGVRRSAALLACGFLAGLAAAVPTAGLFALSQNLLEPLGFAPEPQPAVAWLMDPATPPRTVAALAAAALALAPLSEEILYRAVLFGGLAARGRPVRAAVLSSLFFAALHLSVPAVPPLFALALLFCALWRRWGLAASFGAHAGFNAANVAFALLFF